MFSESALQSLNGLHYRADAMLEHGGKATPAFLENRAHWDAYDSLRENDTLADLAAAAIAGDKPERLLRLTVDAMLQLQFDQTTRASVRDHVARSFLTAQQDEWAKSAPGNYDAARSAYNTAAAALLEAIGTVDPDADPADVMAADERTRAAWAAVPTLAGAVDQAMRFLEAAADELGLDTTEAGMFALAVDPSSVAGKSRRHVWSTWDDETSRAGRWVALHRLGATLTAPAPENHQPYRRPHPIEVRYLKTDSGFREVNYDPETDTPKGAIPPSATAWSA